MSSKQKLMGRREFTNTSAKLFGAIISGVALEEMLKGCLSSTSDVSWSTIPTEEFDIYEFSKWYKKNRLYNGMNPNLLMRHRGGLAATFRTNAFNNKGWTPGLGYSASEMYAVSRGRVLGKTDLGRLTTRLGGWMVLVGHPNESTGYDNPYVSYYAHLGKVHVKAGQKVERGALIGSRIVKHDCAKFMLTEGGLYTAWVDADKFGPMHSYMEYCTGPLEIDDQNEENRILTRERLTKQLHITLDFDEHRLSNSQLHLADLKHRNSKKRTWGWSMGETFKFLETLYEIRPDQFPTLDREEYESIKKTFYDNQPVILTLPVLK